MKLKKLQTGIAAFDHISDGGLPLGRSTLVAGSSGSAKTLLGAQFLAMGILLYDQPGVFVTFEEQVDDIRDNLKTFNWDVDAWERDGKLLFVDATSKEEDTIIVGDYDLGAFRARLERAIGKVKAQRVVIDSIGSIFAQFSDNNRIRQELFKVVTVLNRLNVTSIITAERTKEYGKITKHGVEEFLTDNVIVLRNVLKEEKRRRTIEILKYRGSRHEKGEIPFTIHDEKAILIIPLSSMNLNHEVTDERVSSGNSTLDKMFGGGIYKGAIVLVSGAIGSGKTLLVSSFAQAIRDKKEKCLLIAYEESRNQLVRNASGFNIELEELEKEGLLHIISVYPEVVSLEDHFINIQHTIDEFKPDRVAVDGLSALSRISDKKGFQQFIIAFTSYLKDKQLTSMFTSTTPVLAGGTSETEGDISPLTDSIILLRYVEKSGIMERSIAVLKMRGSKNDAAIRQFMINDKGIEIGKPFVGISGILTGNTGGLAK